MLLFKKGFLKEQHEKGKRGELGPGTKESERFDLCPLTHLAVCSGVKYSLVFGAHHSKKQQQLLKKYN